MLERFTKFYKAVQIEEQSLVLELTHDEKVDWLLTLYHEDSDTVIYSGSCSSLNLLIAEAYVRLADWCFCKGLYDIEVNL